MGFPSPSTALSGHIFSRTVDFDQESASNSFISNFLMQKVTSLDLTNSHTVKFQTLSLVPFCLKVIFWLIYAKRGRVGINIWKKKCV